MYNDEILVHADKADQRLLDANSGPVILEEDDWDYVLLLGVPAKAMQFLSRNTRSY